MPVPAPKGLALTGAILGIVVGAALLIFGVMGLVGRGNDEMKLAAVIMAVIGAAGVTLGSIGCTIKAGVILANAIIFTLVTVFFSLGFTSSMLMNRMGGIVVICVLLSLVTAIFSYIGFAQAARYKAAQRNAS